MPNVETVPELVEELANLLGVYGVHDESCGQPGRPTCRVCWTQAVENRIRKAVDNERLLSRG